MQSKQKLLYGTKNLFVKKVESKEIGICKEKILSPIFRPRINKLRCARAAGNS